MDGVSFYYTQFSTIGVHIFWFYVIWKFWNCMLKFHYAISCWLMTFKLCYNITNICVNLFFWLIFLYILWVEFVIVIFLSACSTFCFFQGRISEWRNHLVPVDSRQHFLFGQNFMTANSKALDVLYPWQHQYIVNNLSDLHRLLSPFLILKTQVNLLSQFSDSLKKTAHCGLQLMHLGMVSGPLQKIYCNIRRSAHLSEVA